MRSSLRLRRSFVLVSLAACLGAAALVPAAAGAAPAKHDWDTFGFNVQRWGYNPYETTLTAPKVHGLKQKWTFDLGGVALAQPVVATGVDVGGTLKDLVYVAAENASGTIYAIDTSNGQLVWKRNLGAVTVGCTDLPGGVYGAGNTPAIDRADGRLFVVGGTGKLFALDLATGKNKLGFPRFVTTDPEHEYVYSAVTLFKGRVYVATASYCDVAPYQGRVMRFNAIGGKLVDTFYVDGKNGLGPSGGGIWGPGGRLGGSRRRRRVRRHGKRAGDAREPRIREPGRAPGPEARPDGTPRSHARG
jgi:outer membrane protein assembly factor BamB